MAKHIKKIRIHLFLINQRINLICMQVIMGDRPAAERACKDPNPIIDGRKANVNLAILGAKPRGNLQTSKFYLSRSDIFLNVPKLCVLY